jgi:hypothetical protein
MCIHSPGGGGAGKVTIEADVAQVELGVQVDAPNASQAQAQAANSAQAIVSTLQGLNVRRSCFDRFANSQSCIIFNFYYSTTTGVEAADEQRLVDADQLPHALA